MWLIGVEGCGSVGEQGYEIGMTGALLRHIYANIKPRSSLIVVIKDPLDTSGLVKFPVQPTTQSNVPS